MSKFRFSSCRDQFIIAGHIEGGVFISSQDQPLKGVKLLEINLMNNVYRWRLRKITTDLRKSFVGQNLPESDENWGWWQFYGKSIFLLLNNCRLFRGNFLGYSIWHPRLLPNPRDIASRSEKYLPAKAVPPKFLISNPRSVVLLVQVHIISPFAPFPCRPD